MATGTRQHVVGVFDDYEMAQRAIEELRRLGFGENQIGLVARDESSAHERVADDAGPVGEAAASGALAGATLGGLWAIGMSAGLLPIIGPVIAGGALLSIMTSAAGTAAVGGLIGALIGLGVPEEEAHFYANELQSGRAIVTVEAGDRYHEALNVLSLYGAYDTESSVR